MNFDYMIFETQAPEMFGDKHLTGTMLVFIIITLLLSLFFIIFKKTNYLKVIKYTAMFLLLLELMKYSHAFLTDGHFPKHYIPMQLCSFSLYLMPIVAFGKGKIRDFLLPTSFAVGLLAGLIVLLYPATVLGGAYGWIPVSDNILPIISFLYHGTMIFFSLMLVIGKFYQPNIKDFPKTYVSLLAFGFLAIITNAIFGTDMMFLNTANGSPLQFVLVDYGRGVYFGVMLLLAAILLFLPFIPSLRRIVRVSKTSPTLSHQKIS